MKLVMTVPHLDRYVLLRLVDGVTSGVRPVISLQEGLKALSESNGDWKLFDLQDKKFVEPEQTP